MAKTEARLTIVAQDNTKAALDSVRRNLTQVRERADATRPGLAALGQVSGNARLAMQNLAGSAGLVGNLLSAINPAGLAAAAGIGAVIVTLKKAIDVAGPFEQAGLKTEAVLKATGHASGQTADSIRQMSEEIALGTLASVQGVESAAQKLMTFRSIGEDVFRRTLVAAQDLAAVGFGSIESGAVQLGKALEDPIQGISALTRVGVSFSQKQKDVIRDLVETNRVAEAQKLILEAVEQQVGGAGSAEAGGLAGAYDTLGQRVEEFYKKLGDSGPVKIATNALNGLANVIDALNKNLFPGVEAKLKEAYEQLIELRDRRDARRPGLNTAVDAALDREIQKTEQLILTLEREILSRKQAAQAAAEQGRQAQEQMDAERALAEEQERLAKLREEQAKRALQIRERIDATIEQLRRQAATLGMTALEAELYRLKLEGASEAQLKAARTALEAVEAHQAHEQALRDSAAAAEQAEREQQALDASLDQAARRVLDTLDPMRALRREIEELETLYFANRLSLEELDQAMALVEARMHALADGASETGDQMSQFAIQAARNIQDSFADFLFDPFKEGLDGMLTGFTNMLRRMAAELAAQELLKAVFGGLSGGAKAGDGSFGGFMADIAASVNHDGGIVGGAGRRRNVSAAAFIGAPRFHTGGILGLSPNEVPAILERGEEVLTRNDPRHAANGGGVAVNVNINALDSRSFLERAAEVRQELAIGVAQAMRQYNLGST